MKNISLLFFITFYSCINYFQWYYVKASPLTPQKVTKNGLTITPFSRENAMLSFNSLRLSGYSLCSRGLRRLFRQNLALAFSRNEVSKIVEYGRLHLLNGLRPHHN
jgi:hypothetical protein